MSKRLRIFILLLAITWGMFLVLPVSAGTLTCNQRPKVISPQLELLDKQASQMIGNTGEMQVVREMQEMATASKSTYYQTLAAYYMAHNYRWNHHADSLRICLQRLDSLSQIESCGILSLEGRKMLVELHCIAGQWDKAWEEIEVMNRKLEKQSCPAKRIIARTTFAIIYLSTRQEQEAERILLEIISAPEEECTMIYRQSAYLILANMALERHEYKLAYTYLEQIRHALLKLKDDDTGFGRLRYYDLRLHYYVFYIRYCLQRYNMQEAKLTLEKLQNEVKPDGYTGGQILCYGVAADYFCANSQTGRALQAWDKEIELVGPESGYSVVLYRRKADLLDKSGRYEDAYKAYSNLTHLQDSIEQNLYFQQINQFKTEYQADQNRIQNERLSEKSRTLYALIGVLLFFVLLLVVLICVNKRLKKRLHESMLKAERSDRLKSAFLANMNHEIRTPLNAIAGFSQLLVDETDPETSEQYISIIKGNNELLMNLLNDVLDISRIESDTITFTYSKVHVPQLVNELYEVAKLQALWAVNVLKDSTPDLYIYTDRNRLVQILSNLISNAIKHTSEGSISIGYELCDSGMIRFHVTDTGKGISEELQTKIFARFVQAVEAHSKGVGLGLALCKGFVEHLGGEIGVESEEGKGSMFWFTLPVRLPEN